MFTQKSKFLWSLAVFVACIPMLIREIPERYDYLLVITLAIGVLAVTLLWVFAKQKFVPIETFARSRYKLPILIFGALIILCLSGLILSGKLVEFRTFYRVLAYFGLLFGVVGVGVAFFNYLNAK